MQDEIRAPGLLNVIKLERSLPAVWSYLPCGEQARPTPSGVVGDNI
ncbi:MAG TPA: hypothetical protein PKA53_08780 [Sphingobacterium sp.]|nr:hypothetical protein [Sphingobacterium sp.]